MSFLSSYIAKRENLLPHSMGITLACMLVLYVLSHFWAYRIFAEELAEKVEIREVEKLEMHKAKPIVPVKPQERKFVRTPNPKPAAAPSATTKVDPQPAAPRVNVADLMAGLETRTLLATQNAGSRSSPGRNNNISQVRVDANAAPHQFDPNSSFTAAVAAGVHRGRSGAPGNNSASGVGAGVDVGEGSGVGNATGLSAFSTGGGTGIGRRSGKGIGAGTGNGAGTIIGIPGGTGTGNGEPGVSIHELIKWMKAHPGAIPKLVQYDMEHKPGDLASAIAFTMNGRKYEMFLSCNEADMLLRICLIEGGKFTMLKDNGIKEASNFLAMGDVVRAGVAIQSLITSRQAPGERAQQFYNLFWSWWEGERG